MFNPKKWRWDWKMIFLSGDVHHPSQTLHFQGVFFGIPKEVLGWFKKKYQDFDCMGVFLEP